ncbi:hypothetical protein V2J09_008515 [Rumex salicifolius]
MGFSKDQLLARLKELQIDFSQYEHPVVLTVEAQAKYVGHLGGALSKNLFLKDKKQRYYIVSALADTKVDLKVLSQRLGLGKGGLRMAPEEALGELLQVPLGCVTPFAVVNETARNVSLLLDQGFRSASHCLFHPLSNDMTVAISARDFDKFLNSIGRKPAYVDLEANPSVGKDQPPDLASLVPSEAVVIPDSSEKPASLAVPPQEQGNSTKIPTKSAKQINNIKSEKGKPTNTAQTSRSFCNTELFVEEILEKTSSLIISKITELSIKENGNELGPMVSDSIRKFLTSDLSSLAMLLKNTAYTEGFHAAKSQFGKRV